MWNIVSSYFSDTFYLILLLLLIICIFVKRDFPGNRKLLVAIGTYCLFFPILFFACDKLRMGSVFYRFLWVFPSSVIIGIGFTWVLKKKDNTKAGFIIEAFILILLVGNICFNESYLKLPNNIYKIENDVIEAADLIEEDTEKDNIIIIGEVSFLSQVRQYSSRFWWGYTNRECMMNADSGNEGDESARLAGAIQNSNFPQSMNVLSDLYKLRVDYIVLYLDNSFPDHLPQNSYEVIGQTEKYKILKMDYALFNT